MPDSLKHEPLKIVADENILLLDEFFGDMGQIARYPGRTLAPEQLSAADVLLLRSVTRVDEKLLAKSTPAFIGTCTHRHRSY